ncbi:MAG: ATP-binding region ATPase domain protein [Geminicoccaceae bacterium]|nr:ATP-binding region ATPase domain protein [Geminicoccaceae bacterium]
MTTSRDAQPAPDARGREHSDVSAELYRLLVASVRDYAIFALDARGYVLTWNVGAQQLKGYHENEIIGRHFSTFYAREEVEDGKPEMELRVAARDGRFEDEGWRLRKDGTSFWANVVITALRDEHGEVIGFAKVTRDLTERRATEQQAVRLAAESAARAAAEARTHELDLLNQTLQEQALELEAQTEEAQSLTEDLEQTNTQLEEALIQAESSRASAESSERFTREILESIADPFVVQDAEWRFRYINAKAAEVLGAGRHSADDLIGKIVWEVYPAVVGTPVEREMRRAAAEKLPRSFEARSSNGYQWSLLYCYPLPDGGLATQWKDITERKRAEEAARYLARASEVLSESLDYQRTLNDFARLVVPELADWCSVEIVGGNGELVQLAVAHADPEKVKWARELSRRYPPNPDAATGSPHVIRTGEPELYPEIPDELLVAGAVDEEHLRIIREVGIRSAIVVPLVAHDRTLGALTLIAAESGRRYGHADLALALELARRAALAVDNTRLHRAELDARIAAERANRAKSDFLAVMSHELRTPLNAIGGYTQILEMGLHGPITDEQREALERIGRAQRHLLGLINNVLNLARIETGHVEYRIRPVLVSSVLGDLASLVQPQFAARELTLVSRLPEEDGGAEVYVAADREKLIQILTNLLGNAAKFTPAHGEVEMRLTRGAHEGEVMIIVRDSGPGIPADKLELIFEPFVQLERSLTTPAEGAGLGLAISRDLARGMGGDLRADSMEGHGAALILTLPRATLPGDSPRAP